jgi:hypothetical protein
MREADRDEVRSTCVAAVAAGIRAESQELCRTEPDLNAAADAPALAVTVDRLDERADRTADEWCNAAPRAAESELATEIHQDESSIGAASQHAGAHPDVIVPPESSDAHAGGCAFRRRDESVDRGGADVGMNEPSAGVLRMRSRSRYQEQNERDPC